ncbi:hypothetical protein DPMN_054575 [Dreissena polymorpha]|uniref:Uncharacterized protein n=1 Tax=Dreissena polymorpha TaxID=45954 RepID=A0A9D4CQY5_DREPO|nr:hypothetical protein DPMN_054575 [Dreissena polymorpha]
MNTLISFVYLLFSSDTFVSAIECPESSSYVTDLRACESTIMSGERATLRSSNKPSSVPCVCDVTTNAAITLFVNFYNVISQFCDTVIETQNLKFQCVDGVSTLSFTRQNRIIIYNNGIPDVTWCMMFSQNSIAPPTSFTIECYDRDTAPPEIATSSTSPTPFLTSTLTSTNTTTTRFSYTSTRTPMLLSSSTVITSTGKHMTSHSSLSMDFLSSDTASANTSRFATSTGVSTPSTDSESITLALQTIMTYSTFTTLHNKLTSLPNSSSSRLGSSAVSTKFPAASTTISAASTTIHAVSTTISAATTTLHAASSTIQAASTTKPAASTTIPAVSTIILAASTTNPATSMTVPEASTTLSSASMTVPAASTTNPAASTTILAAASASISRDWTTRGTMTSALTIFLSEHLTTPTYSSSTENALSNSNNLQGPTFVYLAVGLCCLFLLVVTLVSVLCYFKRNRTIKENPVPSSPANPTIDPRRRSYIDAYDPRNKVFTIVTTNELHSDAQDPQLCSMIGESSDFFGTDIEAWGTDANTELECNDNEYALRSFNCTSENSHTRTNDYVSHIYTEEGIPYAVVNKPKVPVASQSVSFANMNEEKINKPLKGILKLKETFFSDGSTSSDKCYSGKVHRLSNDGTLPNVDSEYVQHMMYPYEAIYV